MDRFLGFLPVVAMRRCSSYAIIVRRREWDCYITWHSTVSVPNDRVSSLSSYSSQTLFPPLDNSRALWVSVPDS